MTELDISEFKAYDSFLLCISYKILQAKLRYYCKNNAYSSRYVVKVYKQGYHKGRSVSSMPPLWMQVKCPGSDKIWEVAILTLFNGDLWDQQCLGKYHAHCNTETIPISVYPIHIHFFCTCINTHIFKQQRVFISYNGNIFLFEL